MIHMSVLARGAGLLPRDVDDRVVNYLATRLHSTASHFHTAEIRDDESDHRRMIFFVCDMTLKLAIL